MNRLNTLILGLLMLFCNCFFISYVKAGNHLSVVSRPDTLTPKERAMLSKFDDEVKALLRAKAIVDSARALGNVFEKLTSESLIGIPFPLIKKTINNVEYLITIGSIRILPDHISIEVFGSIKTPQGKEMFFGAPEINFSGSGGLVGTSYLGLLSDVGINLDNKRALLTLKKFNKDGGGTYLAFDCDGFQYASLDARFELSRDWVVPVDQNYNPLPTGRVKCDFSIVVEDFNDWLIDVTLPNFALTEFPKVVYTFEKAVFDFSDARNAAGMVFPLGYFDAMDGDEETSKDVAGMSQQQLVGAFSGNQGQGQGISGNGTSSESDESGNSGNQVLPDWRGVYIGHFKVVFPPEFADRTSGERIAVDARHIIIDSRGVSGSIAVENILPLSKGRAANWAFSLDKAGITFMKSKLRGFYLNGKVELPIADTTRPLLYEGQFDLSNQKYILEVKAVNDLNFPVWRVAKVNLLKSSYIKLLYSDSKFLPLACLNGKLTILALSDKGAKDVEAPNIVFQKLVLTSTPPYINVDKLSLGGDVTLNGSPVSLKNIGFGMDKDSLKGFFFTADVNFENEGESGISGGMGAAILGQVSIVDEKQRWQFEKIDVKDGSIAAKFPGFEFRGSMKTFSNEAYGTGFQAQLQLKIDFSGNESAEASSKNQFVLDAFGIFGRRENPELKYWLVDVKAEFPCVPIFTGVKLCGIMGGAYRRMSPVELGSPANNFDLGVLPSGIKYEPDADAGLGIRAGVKIQVAGGNTINGSALFEFAFSSSGSLDRVFFQGMVEIQVPADKIPGVATKMAGIIDKYKTNKAQYVNLLSKEDSIKAKQNNGNEIKATLTTELCFEKQFYHSTLEVTVNIVKGYLHGYGQADMLADFKNDKYHFYLGTFAQKIMLGINVEGFSANVWTYTMLGNDIPGIPPLDPKVASALGISTNQNNLDAAGYMKNVETGTGMLFGAGLGLDFDVCKKIIFVSVYAKASFNAGFEAGILDFGSGKRCNDGRGPIGKDGWYTFARFYIIASAEGGRRKKCKKEYNKWVNFTVGAFAEGSFPNPNYLYAKGVAKFNGFSLSFDVQKGSKCL